MSTNIFTSIPFGKETFHPIRYDASVFEMDYTIQAGAGVPSHVHNHMQEKFIILDGEMTFTMDGKKEVRQAGDEIIIPMGTVHAIKNTGKTIASMKVSFEPCADTHRFFEIYVELEKDHPKSSLNIMKYFYLVKALGLKEFSSIHPPFMMRTLNGMIQLMGAIQGWHKLIPKFTSK